MPRRSRGAHGCGLTLSPGAAGEEALGLHPISGSLGPVIQGPQLSTPLPVGGDGDESPTSRPQSPSGQQRARACEIWNVVARPPGTSNCLNYVSACAPWAAETQRRVGTCPDGPNTEEIGSALVRIVSRRIAAELGRPVEAAPARGQLGLSLGTVVACVCGRFYREQRRRDLRAGGHPGSRPAPPHAPSPAPGLLPGGGGLSPGHCAEGMASPAGLRAPGHAPPQLPWLRAGLPASLVPMSSPRRPGRCCHRLPAQPQAVGLPAASPPHRPRPSGPGLPPR